MSGFQNEIFDPIFARYGLQVYTYAYIEKLREENLSLEGNIKNWIPQKGFQEKVAINDADVLIIGGKRGGGKSLIMELSATRNIDNPLFTIHGFRKEEDDIKRGLWKTSTMIYSGIATPKQSDFVWIFPSGAISKYEHLANEAEVDRRFRGAEMPFIIIDELPQIKETTFFTLLASNRNSLGIQNQFIASCNPVGPKHWVHKFLSWYIDPETKTIIKDRNGIKRYFFKYGKEITEIAWGNSKEEVYEKAKGHIDDKFDKRLEILGLNPLDLINSLCFIEGDYAENKIFIKRDKNYLGNLAQQGGEQSTKDIKGIWEDSENGGSIISYDKWEEMYQNPCQRNGIITAVADVALTRDLFTIGFFDGNHLFDIECFRAGSQTALDLVKKALKKRNVELKNFAFDSDGIGSYLIEPMKAGTKFGAYAFHNNSESSNKNIWYNQKSECAEKFAIRIEEGDFSIEPSLLEKKIDDKTLREHLDEQRLVIRQKDTNNGKFQLINKVEMKKILGGKRSPDIIEMIIMHEYFNIKRKKGALNGLGLLGNF